MSLFFITGSKNKFEEVKTVISDVEQLDIDLPEIQHNDAHEIIKAKLQEAVKHRQSELMVEDTSLYFDCLNGLPGPLIKWFMKTVGNDGLANIAEKLGNTKAQAKTIIGYANSKGEVEFFEGVIEGTIVAPRGETGFGWDPIFLPDGHQKTFAEMGQDEKNTLSMRKIAALKLQERLS
ncbi:MAG TPA: non-canonical purine NTP pyrophosphatase [Candidatus Saccharimonadales bacterium]|nr:non-canonical purine NTP pyrophosphatase [Candidatus Saccharimonadales bacterium]